MKIDRVHRRMFLQGLGGAALALPFLPSLLPRAEAQAIPRRKRFIAIKSYSTQNIRDFYPSRAISGYTLRPYGGNETSGANGKNDGTLALNQNLAESSGRHSSGTAYTGKWAPLSAFSGAGVSRILGPELNPFLSKMLLLRGLDFMPETNHNEGGMLGNFRGGSISDVASSIREFPTIDQVLAYSNKFYSSVPPGARSLHLSPGRANTFSYTNGGMRGGAVTQVVADTDPRVAYNRLFANFTPPDPGMAENPNRRLVDRVIEDYRRARDDVRLGQTDRDTLERHIGFMSELEARLAGGGGSVTCRAPTQPASVPNQGVNVATLRQSYGLMIDLMVAAIQCDMTRIVTLDVYKAIGQAAGQDAGFEHSCASCQSNPNPTDWHRAAHDWDQPAQREKVVSINEWIAREIFLPVLQKLDVDEGDGTTYLDNSVVFWGNELGMNHLSYSVPVLLAGGAGGYLKTGRYIDYIDWNQPVKFSQHNGMVIEGVPYNRLLVSLLQAFGLGPADYELEPGAGYGDTSTVGKTASAFALDYDRTQLAQGLPDIRA